MTHIYRSAVGPIFATYVLYFRLDLRLTVGGRSRFCAAARAARPTDARAAHRPYAPRKVSYDLSGQRAVELQDPRTPCARPPAPRRSSAGSAASSPPREGPRCRAPRASPRAAKDKPGTQVGLLKQTSTADQVSRCAAEQLPVLRNGKREARATSRSAPSRAGHGQGRGVRAAAAEFGGFWR